MSKDIDDAEHCPSVLTGPGDKVRGKRIICQYRKERQAVLIRLTGGHKGIRRIIEGLPAEADRGQDMADQEDRMISAK